MSSNERTYIISFGTTLTDQFFHFRYGGPPAIAMFANHNRAKRETFRNSVFAPRVLADYDIPVVMKVSDSMSPFLSHQTHISLKSDHPVLDSRHLIYEVQQAHYYGLQPNLALASVFTAPAIAAGVSHRVGFLREGADGDIVVWDSHPLHLGATPRQVWIDGIPQLGGDDTSGLVWKEKEGEGWKEVPKTPNWDKERKDAIKYEGEPPLVPENVVTEKVVFTNLKGIRVFESSNWVNLDYDGSNSSSVLVENGQVVCYSHDYSCLKEARATSVDGQVKAIDLHGGFIGPGLMSFGSPLGTTEIVGEASTGPGLSYDAYSGDVPKIMDDVSGLVKTVDALKFETRSAL